MAKPQLENGYTRIANELLEALAKVRMPDHCRRVLLTVMRMTYGFGKKSDHLALTRVADLTNLPADKVAKAKKWLIKNGFLEVIQSSASRSSASRSSAKGDKLMIVKDYDKWAWSPKVEGSASTSSASTSSDKRNITKEIKNLASPEVEKTVPAWKPIYDRMVEIWGGARETQAMAFCNVMLRDWGLDGEGCLWVFERYYSNCEDSGHVLNKSMSRELADLRGEQASAYRKYQREREKGLRETNLRGNPY